MGRRGALAAHRTLALPVQALEYFPVLVVHHGHGRKRHVKPISAAQSLFDIPVGHLPPQTNRERNSFTFTFIKAIFELSSDITGHCGNNKTYCMDRPLVWPYFVDASASLAALTSAHERKRSPFALPKNLGNA